MHLCNVKSLFGDQFKKRICNDFFLNYYWDIWMCIIYEKKIVLMHCWICWDIISYQNNRCMCIGDLSYVHDVCIDELVEYSAICTICNHRYTLSNMMLFKIFFDCLFYIFLTSVVVNLFTSVFWWKFCFFSVTLNLEIICMIFQM